MEDSAAPSVASEAKAEVGETVRAAHLRTATRSELRRPLQLPEQRLAPSVPAPQAPSLAPSLLSIVQSSPAEAARAGVACNARLVPLPFACCRERGVAGNARVACCKARELGRTIMLLHIVS